MTRLPGANLAKRGQTGAECLSLNDLRYVAPSPPVKTYSNWILHQGARNVFREVCWMWIDNQGFELDEPDYFLDEDNMPSFIILEDMAYGVFEIG